MKPFIHDDFLLKSGFGKELYHGYAEDKPILDYHCHLSPKEIAGNKPYENIAQVWLGGDHYKWRLMRANGISEEDITGGASWRAKFSAWAKTVPQTLGNPLFHWTHLELKRFFGIDELLSPKTEESIWNQCNEQLKGQDFLPRELIRRSNVKALCTTDDPIDDLKYHREIATLDDFGVAVFPTFRPDKALNFTGGEQYTGYLKALDHASGMHITRFRELLEALGKRIDFFHAAGCRLSDHALILPYYREASDAELENLFQKVLKGEALTPPEAEALGTAVLLFLGEEYARRGWSMQIHLGCIRNNNARMFEKLGPDTGYDSMADGPVALPLARLLNALDEKDALPRTILYSLNPKDNEPLATLMGHFQGGGIPGKIQLGSGWWFNDQRDGMERQMTALANLGLLSRFVGMLTDSRSFLSYPRHEYFRRILCELLGTWAEKGEIPRDAEWVGKMVSDISYDNALNYFRLPF